MRPVNAHPLNRNSSSIRIADQSYLPSNLILILVEYLLLEGRLHIDSETLNIVINMLLSGLSRRHSGSSWPEDSPPHFRTPRFLYNEKGFNLSGPEVNSKLNGVGGGRMGGKVSGYRVGEFCINVSAQLGQIVFLIFTHSLFHTHTHTHML